MGSTIPGLDDPPVPVVVVTDLGRAAEWYRDHLGLDHVEERGEVWLLCRDGTPRLLLSLRGQPSEATHAVAGWFVKDIVATVAELRSKGVSFETFGLAHEGGVVTLPPDQVAWFHDVDGNLLSVAELDAAMPPSEDKEV